MLKKIFKWKKKSAENLMIKHTLDATEYFILVINIDVQVIQGDFFFFIKPTLNYSFNCFMSYYKIYKLYYI